MNILLIQCNGNAIYSLFDIYPSQVYKATSDKTDLVNYSFKTGLLALLAVFEEDNSICAVSLLTYPAKDHSVTAAIFLYVTVRQSWHNVTTC